MGNFIKIIAGVLIGAFAMGGCSAGDSQTTVEVKEISGEWIGGETSTAVGKVEKDGVVDNLLLTIGGSGTEACRPVVESVRDTGEDLVVELRKVDKNTPCTADLRAYTWSIDVADPSTVSSVTIEGGDFFDTKIIRSDDFVVVR